MITPMRENTKIRQALFAILGSIAPEADLTTLNPDVDVRATLDIDSFDFLNVLIGVEEKLGVSIPEADYGRLVSLNDIIIYVAARLK